MRKFTLIFTLLVAVVTSAMAVDYSTRYDGQTKSGRAINSVSIISPAFGESKLTLSSTENTSLVVDRTADITFRCRVGETVTPNTGYTAGWMHTYVYLDADNNGFVVDSETSADLVSFAYYNGKNSNGATVADNTVAAPAFVAPTTAGTYRLRFKIDWNSIDPQGNPGESNGKNTMSSNNGGIVDVMLQVEDVPVHKVVYNYKQNGEIVGTMTYNVAEGSAYPDVVSGLYGVTVTGLKPEGTVIAQGSYDIAVEIGEFPFEYAASYNEIGDKWYNLVMHSNEGGAPRYRTYLGAGNETTLAWGEHRSLTGAGDDYYWAFVGDPINGFRVVNKAKGDGFILSSNGSANPVMKEEATLAEGYNITWQISNRTANDGNDWVEAGDWFCLKYRDNWYMNANAGNGQVNFWNSDDNGSGILAVKPLVIDADADYGTYFAETSFVIPETLGAEVYYVNNVENGYAKFQQITGTVYKETGIIVKYETESDITYAPEFVSPGATTAVEDNLLKGTTQNTTINKEGNNGYYVLGLVEGEAGFAKPNEEATFTNKAFRAYLETPAQQGAVAFYGFDFGGNTTAVEKVEVENEVKEIYDLQGRRIDEITKPGIYVVNGNKVLVK